ncbi:hypothetical protein BJF79_46245 [Actinomadura sp. CNU-125]|nr:hypothetical protein BJF79_46245 [Actinomadura sp. CNU-125]
MLDRDVLAAPAPPTRLAPHLPLLRELLRGVADETEHLLVITDEAGRALWTQGPRRTRRAAERIGLLEGFCWAEDEVGTNGIGTALAEGRPEHVYAAEHVAHVLRGWSCAGAPVVDPDTGRVIGCVDVSATADRLHPAMTALVATAARLAEARLELAMQRRDERLRERYLPHLTGLGGTGAGGAGSGAATLVTATGRILAGGPDGWRGRRLQVPEPSTITLPPAGPCSPSRSGRCTCCARGPGARPPVPRAPPCRRPGRGRAARCWR